MGLVLHVVHTCMYKCCVMPMALAGCLDLQYRKVAQDFNQGTQKMWFVLCRGGGGEGGAMKR